MADAALPGDADDLVAPARDAFTELVGRQRRLGQRLARFEIEARDARTPILAGAFVEMTVVPEEPLSEAVRVVRPGVDDAVAAADNGGRLIGGSRRSEDRSEEHTSELQSLMRISY